MAPPENDNDNGSIYAAPGITEGLDAHLKFLYTTSCSMRIKHNELEVLVYLQSYDINEYSTVLTRLGGMSPTTGVLGWRATNL